MTEWAFNYGDTHTYDKNMHENKMQYLFSIINNDIINLKPLNTIKFYCGTYAEIVLKECFIINNINIDNIVFDSKCKDNVIEYADVKINITPICGIPILFYSPLNENILIEMTTRLLESIKSNNLEMALIDANNIIEQLKRKIK
jgi:hypothetical protein